MGQISIELVPRNREDLLLELQQLRHHFPDIDTINIPDLLKFPLRSWEACILAKITTLMPFRICAPSILT